MAEPAPNSPPLLAHERAELIALRKLYRSASAWLINPDPEHEAGMRLAVLEVWEARGRRT